MSWRAFMHEVPDRLRTNWRFKALLAAGIGIPFCACYLLIGHYPVLPARTLSLTWIDRAVGFHPYEWVWVYQSLYLPVNVIPWLARGRDDLLRYVKGLLILTLISFAIFIIFPVRAPKPTVAEPQGMYKLLLSYDAPCNAMPSLHAALLIYTFGFGRRVLGDAIPRGLVGICVAWGALILYATIATKEHYAIDIVAGVALATGVHAWVWRRTACVIRPGRSAHPAPLPAAAGGAGG